MFSIAVNQYNSTGSVRISGCPQHGIAAIDWRRERGIKEDPSNCLPIKLTNPGTIEEREAVVRELGGGNANADIGFSTDSSWLISPEAASAYFRGEWQQVVRELWALAREAEEQREAKAKREIEEAEARRTKLIEEGQQVRPEDLLVAPSGDGKWGTSMPSEWVAEWTYRSSLPGPLRAVMQAADELAEIKNEQAAEAERETERQRQALCLAWARQHGDEVMRAAAEAGLLDPEEAKAAWREAIFAPIDWPRYERITISDVCTCEDGYETTDCRLSCSVAPSRSVPLALFPKLQELQGLIREHLGDGAEVEVREHSCSTDECSESLSRLGVLVSVDVGPGLRFSREFGMYY